MPQNLHAPLLVSTLYIEDLLPLEASQSWVGQVERNGNPRYSIRREPLVGEPEVRTKLDLSLSKLIVELMNSIFEHSPVNGDAQVTHSHVQKLIIGHEIKYGLGSLLSSFGHCEIRPKIFVNKEVCSKIEKDNRSYEKTIAFSLARASVFLWFAPIDAAAQKR